ncbi:peptide ABC transporter substrate-binding protein [Candidatus Dojkabacteria bacterium]|nr:peptide ABC transporter substrate-binding protein [Candidatus Dojkabacteria bacterium]
MIIPQKESLVSKIRIFFWNYPESIFGKSGFIYNLFVLYKKLRPVSHILIFVIFFVTVVTLGNSKSLGFVRWQNDILVEGVIIGDSTLSRINPIIPTNNQLEVDLARLIYLPLVRVNPSGEVQGVLARSWESVEEGGKEYKFYLRDDVYWHDGEKFTADDVLATFEALRALGGGEEKSIVSKEAELAQKMEVIKADNYTIIFRLEEIVPTFFEDIEFGILPKHILENVSLSTFSWARFNLKPIGTGPFIFKSWKDFTIVLASNEHYFESLPKISEIHIRMFKTGDEAVDALKNGRIHILTDPSTAILSDLAYWPNMTKVKSTTLYRRYWAIYFNLKEGGPSIFKDKAVRQAISSTINRDLIIEQVETAGEEALGPIQKNSWAYNEDAQRYLYDPTKAKELLENAGWEQKEIGGKTVRIKGDEVLRFELSYLEKNERQLITESIKSDLEKLGIIVNLDPRSSSDLNEALVATRNFEAVLYGVETPIDPDRIRLWHSEAINYPGLNISSYVSEKKGAVIGEAKELERVSLVDAALENGRSSLDQKKRNGAGGLSIGYQKFQEMLLDDCPVVFLYHPVFTYVVHARVKGIDLSQMSVPEDRYLSVTEWYIE